MLPDAWFAGFFDADGCVSIARKAARGRNLETFSLACQIAQIDTNPLMRFHERFGGSVRPDGRRETRVGNPVYMWSVVSRDAEAFLMAVTPFLVLKRGRAELALEFRKLFVGDNVKPRRWLDRPEVAAKCARIHAARQLCHEEMLALNGRRRI